MSLLAGGGARGTHARLCPCQGSMGPMQRGQIDARAFNFSPLHPDPPLHTDLGGAEREPPKRGRNPKEVLATSREKTHALSESSAYQTLP